MDDGIIFNEDSWPWYSKHIHGVSNLNFQPNNGYVTDSLGNLIINGDIENQVEKTNMDINKLKPIKVKFYNCKTTVIWWNDKTKTSVVCDKEDTFSEETGVAMCYLKKIYGNTGKYMNKINNALNKAKDDKTTKKAKYCYVCIEFRNNLHHYLKCRPGKVHSVKFAFRAKIMSKSNNYVCVKFPKDSIQAIYGAKKIYCDGTLRDITEDDAIVFENDECFENYIEAQQACNEYNNVLLGKLYD